MNALLTHVAKLDAGGEASVLNALLTHTTNLCLGEASGKALSAKLTYQAELVNPYG